MKIGKTITIRIDDEIREAIQILGGRLGTSNISQILRTGFMLGVDESAPVEIAIARRAFKEGILAGVATLKANTEAAIASTFEESP